MLIGSVCETNITFWICLIMTLSAIKDLMYSAIVNVADGCCWSLTCYHLPCDHLPLPTKTDAETSKTSGWRTSKWQDSSRSRRCVLCSNSTRYQVDNPDTRTNFFYTWRNFTTFTRQSWLKSIGNLSGWEFVYRDDTGKRNAAGFTIRPSLFLCNERVSQAHCEMQLHILQVGFLSFDQFPSMPRPVRNALVTREQLDQMFGQSLRQQTAWSITTKDSAGTLPVNLPFDCAWLAQKEEEISSDQSSSPEVLICEDNIVCVRKCGQPPIQPSPFYLGRVDGNMYAVENPAVEGY